LTVLQTINTGNTITNGQDTTGFLEINFRVGTQDTLFKDGRNLRSGRLGGSITTSSSGNSTKVETSLLETKNKKKFISWIYILSRCQKKSLENPISRITQNQIEKWRSNRSEFFFSRLFGFEMVCWVEIKSNVYKMNVEIACVLINRVLSAFFVFLSIWFFFFFAFELQDIHFSKKKKGFLQQEPSYGQLKDGQYEQRF
jgi:hypothetical protein